MEARFNEHGQGLKQDRFTVLLHSKLVRSRKLVSHQRQAVDAGLVGIPCSSQYATVRLEARAVEVPVVDEGGGVEQVGHGRCTNRRQITDFSLKERSQVVLLGHQTNRSLMMLSLAEHLSLGVHQIRHQPAANPRQVPVGAVHVGFNTHRHRAFDEFDGQAERDLLKPSEARRWMQQQGGLSEHFQRHHTRMVGDTFDGVVDKEGVIGGGERALRGQTLTFLERHHFVNEREACGVGHGRRHFTRKFERCFSEGGEAVHQAQRTATKDTTLATS